ncbi:HEAT repeat domain-containing protein [uncultured Maribacter sp.]|uniref:HEAT repeat domain-containing protein n=1 Tax=uncultured Maribacter sp. TaxID=431308 RepID=UPI0026264814|nr:HEAT repeat domain-containing protein [uncultured Maribacter sp.]
MDKKHIIELLPEYIDGQLSDNKKKEVELHLKECEECIEELEGLKNLFTSFKEEEEVSPSDTLRTNFFEEIELEKITDSKIVNLNKSSFKEKPSWTNNFLKIAASIVLLVSVYFLGKQQQNQVLGQEITQLTSETNSFKQMAMLSLMGNKSASKRIQGVNFIEEFAEPDEAIVNALVDRMLTDENINVRRTAVEVLSEFISSETVKTSFIKALKSEEDPAIQITIIQVLGKIQEKKAAGAMKYLLEQENTQPYVKEELESVLPNII